MPQVDAIIQRHRNDVIGAPIQQVEVVVVHQLRSVEDAGGPGGDVAGGCLGGGGLYALSFDRLLQALGSCVGEAIVHRIHVIYSAATDIPHPKGAHPGVKGVHDAFDLPFAGATGTAQGAQGGEHT